MDEIGVILPIHVYEEWMGSMIKNAVKSVVKNTEVYKGILTLYIVCPESVYKELKTLLEEFDEEGFLNFIVNTGETDFCSQINLGAEVIETKYFSILEYDDEYSPKWFKMASDYYYTHEEVSLFLPINALYEYNNTVTVRLLNDVVWASSFSNEMGFIDSDCLQSYASFNITGGIFNRVDFLRVGGFKPSIKLAFNYELLLRMANKGLQIYVVPKEGYIHLVGRHGSLSEEYANTIGKEEVTKWFDLAKREYPFVEDRKKTIIITEKEELN